MQATACDRKYASVSAMAVLAILLHVPPASADDDDDADRHTTPLIEEFFLIESVYPQERGETQLTLGTAHTSGAPEGDGQSGRLGIEYGISDRLQVELSQIVWFDREVIEDDVRASNSGLGDLEIGVKYAFEPAREDGIWVAVGLEITAPVGDVDEELGEGFWVYEPFVIVSRDLGDTTSVTLTLAYGFLDRDAVPEDADEIEAEDNELELGVGIVRAFGPNWRTTMELTYETNELGGDGNEVESYLTPGLVYKGRQGFELGLGASAGLTDDAADWSILGSLSYEF